MSRRPDFRTLRLAWAWLLASLLLVTSCDRSDGPDAPPREKYLVESSAITNYSVAQLGTRLASISPFVSGLIKNGVEVYRISYRTKNTDGSDIIASGALILPDTDQPVSLVSVQHGTITNPDDAPSNFRDGSEGSTVGALFGSLGYIIAYPDYIGYGATSNLPHPYEHRASLASASLDMLRAVEEFLEDQQAVKWNKKLYIAGYSEGGFATLALQKLIEEQAASEFDLRASSCGAGAYDKSAFMNHLINNETHGIAGYNSLYLWVTLTYDRVYGLNRPASAYFKEPYASQIAANGKDVTISQSLNTIFKDSFVKGINDGTDTAFLNAVADNDVYDWKPRTPTQLYHGTADQLVFYFNSKNAYDAMRARGATNVELIEIKGGDHGSSLTSYLLGTLSFFQATP